VAGVTVERIERNNAVFRDANEGAEAPLGHVVSRNDGYVVVEK